MTKLDKAFLPLMNEVVPSGYRLQEYGPLRAIVSKGGAPDEDRQFIIVGYASPQVIDREKHLIKREALAEDLPRFLAHPKYRNANIVHSNIQVAEVLPAWTNPDTGEEWTTHVDEVGLFCVVKVRTDRFRPAICKRVEEDILSGKLNSFSISGDAPFESRQYTCANDQCFWVIDKIELYEITICEEGVNQDAKFSVVAKADAMRLSQFCADGSCPINLGGVGMMNPTETKSPSPAGGDAPEGVAVGAEGAKGLQSDVARDDPRQADQEKPGQDWVQKASGDCGGQDNCPLNEQGKSCQYHGPAFTKAAPTMIRRDVTPTAGGGGFNTTRPDQLKAAESEIEDDDGSFGSRVQKYLRKGDLGTLDHGISSPKLETTGGGGGKMTKEKVDEHLDAQGSSAHHQPDWQAFDPEDESGVHSHSPGDMSHGLEESKRENPGHSHWHTAPQHGNQGTIRGRSTPNPPSNRTPQHHLDRENLALPDNGEPTAIQKGGWYHEHDGYPTHPIGVKKHAEYLAQKAGGAAAQAATNHNPENTVGEQGAVGADSSETQEADSGERPGADFIDRVTKDAPYERLGHELLIGDRSAWIRSTGSLVAAARKDLAQLMKVNGVRLGKSHSTRIRGWRQYDSGLHVETDKEPPPARPSYSQIKSRYGGNHEEAYSDWKRREAGAEIYNAKHAGVRCDFMSGQFIGGNLPQGTTEKCQKIMQGLKDLGYHVAESTPTSFRFTWPRPWEDMPVEQRRELKHRDIESDPHPSQELYNYGAKWRTEEGSTELYKVLGQDENAYRTALKIALRMCPAEEQRAFDAQFGGHMTFSKDARPYRNDALLYYGTQPQEPVNRALSLAMENQWLATQLALATKSDEQRRKDKNAYMAQWRKEHPNGGRGSGAKHPEPALNGQPNGSPGQVAPDKVRQETRRQSRANPGAYDDSLHGQAQKPGGAVDREKAGNAAKGKSFKVGNPVDIDLTGSIAEGEGKDGWKVAGEATGGMVPVASPSGKVYQVPVRRLTVAERRSELTGNGMRTRSPEENQGISVPPREGDRPKMKMPQTDSTGHTDFDRQRDGTIPRERPAQRTKHSPDQGGSRDYIARRADLEKRANPEQKRALAQAYDALTKPGSLGPDREKTRAAEARAVIDRIGNQIMRAPQSEGTPGGREKKPAAIGGPGAQQRADDIFAKYGGDPTKKALAISKAIRKAVKAKKPHTDGWNDA